MTTRERVENIIQEIVLEHGIAIRRIKCDCLACRKDGRISKV
jgi:hypothetical protein